MYIVSNEITVTWVLGPTDVPLTANDFDISFVPSTLQGTYTDGGIVNYIAPTATTAGSLQYLFTPLAAGKYVLELSTGSNIGYEVSDKKYFWIFQESPTTQPVTKTPGAISYPIPILFPPPVVSDFQDIDIIYTAASDGTNIVFYGISSTNSGFFLTNHDLDEPVLQIDAQSLPLAPSFGNPYDLLEYSPKHGRFVSVYNAGNGGVIYSDDLGVTWTKCTYPTTSPSLGTTPSTLRWNAVLELWYLAWNNGSRLMVSTDGITWTNQASLEVLGGVHPYRMWDMKTLRVGVDDVHILPQWEEYCYKLNGGANSTGWTKTANQGVTGGIGTWPLYNWQTDGTTIVCTAYGHQAHTGNISNFASWVDYSNTDLGWATGNPSHNAFAYIPEFDRPWIACLGTAAAPVWYDATNVVTPDYQVSTNPFFAGKPAMRTGKWNTQSGFLRTFDGYWLGVFNNNLFDGSKDQLLVGNN